MANTLKFGNGNWAIKEDSTLAYSDQYDNFKPLPFDFTRASNATVVNKDGLIETVANGIPRIDFTDSEDGALLLEPQRTNYVLLSNDFSSITGNGFVTSNYGTSPKGLSVSRVLFTGVSQLIGAPTSLGNGVVCNFSAYVKGVQGEFIKFAAGGQDIAHTFSGEWERLSGSTTSINNSWNLNTYGGATARDFLMCGAQLEQGSYATSYIPTQGSAATRVLETCSQSGLSGIIGQTEGVIYCEFEIQTTGEDMVIMNVSNSATPANSMYFYLTSGNALKGYVDNSGTQVTISSGVLVEGTYKAALAYKANDFAFYLNGSLIGTDTSGTVPTCSVLRLDNYTDVPTYQEKTKIAEAKLYNTRLSNSELAELTTI